MNDRGRADLDHLNVSRETLERLDVFENVLRKWNPRINLVSRNSLEDFWTRHIVDSIQVFRCVQAQDQTQGHWVDLGSGGGFPGLIVAILAAAECSDLKVTLIESDQRKSAFLRTVARETGVECKILAQRIEQAEPQAATILSARALADLSLLFSFAERHLNPDGIALFPKGVTWEKEIAAAQRQWQFDYEPITSQTEPEAVVLKIKGISRD